MSICSRAGDEWWLMRAGVVEAKITSASRKLWRADLPEGVWANGRAWPTSSVPGGRVATWTGTTR